MAMRVEQERGGRRTPRLNAHLQGTLVSMQRLTAKPGGFYGQPVPTSGAIAHIISPTAFVRTGKVLVTGPGNGIPRRATTPAQGLRTGTNVPISSPFRAFGRAAGEREFGLPLPENLFVNWGGKPAIIARTLAVAKEAGCPWRYPHCRAGHATSAARDGLKPGQVFQHGGADVRRTRGG